VRVERHDLSSTAEPAECLVDVAGRHGADPIQVLGEDQVGLDLGDARLVEPVQGVSPAVAARTASSISPRGRFSGSPLEETIGFCCTSGG
jgi:hypothetical protein